MTDIETARLRLRQWRTTDYEPFARLNADPEVMAYFPEPLSRKQSDAMADKVHAFIEHNGWGLWAVEAPGIAPFIGFTGLNIPSFDLPFMPCVEIGWRLARQYWGNGYATEAARAALRVGFEGLNLPEIVSFTPTDNRRSRAVMERIGMHCDGEAFDHPGVDAPSGLCRHVFYRLTRTGWKNRTRAA